MRIFTFTVPGSPPIMRRNRSKPGQRPYPTQLQKDDYKRVREAFEVLYGKPCSLRSFELSIFAIFPTPKVHNHFDDPVEDLTHVFDAIQDALQGYLWENDRQVRQFGSSYKRWADPGEEA